MSLEIVDVRQVWDTAEPMLDNVSKNQEWRSQDIYAACVSGNASMFMPDDDRSGVVVLCINQNRYTGQAYMFIWVAFSPDLDAQEEFGENIESLARENHCAYIQFESSRAGFMRRGGWKPGNTIYRKEV